MKAKSGCCLRAPLLPPTFRGGGDPLQSPYAVCRVSPKFLSSYAIADTGPDTLECALLTGDP